MSIRGTPQDPLDVDYTDYVLQTPSPTEYILVAENNFQTNAFAALDFNPANNTEHFTMRNIIAERNWYHATSTLAADNMIWIRASNVTIRNEIIDMSHLRYFETIRVLSSTTGMTAPSNVDIFNNTFYSSTNSGSDGTVDVVAVDGGPSGVSNVRMKNNLVYMPALSAGYSALIRCAPSSGNGCTEHTGIEVSNNTANTSQIKTSPLFTNGSGTYSAPSDFQLSVGSYAIGGGIVVPVWSDFGGDTRTSTSTFDIGAYSY